MAEKSEKKKHEHKQAQYKLQQEEQICLQMIEKLEKKKHEETEYMLQVLEKKKFAEEQHMHEQSKFTEEEGSVQKS